MAEALGHYYAPEWAVMSAGSSPTTVRPEALSVLSEINIDASSQYSKSVDSIDPKWPELVITLCAEEVCPVFASDIRRLHWPLEDPAVSSEIAEVERLARFRLARDEIKERILTLKKQN